MAYKIKNLLAHKSVFHFLFLVLSSTIPLILNADDSVGNLFNARAAGPGKGSSGGLGNWGGGSSGTCKPGDSCYMGGSSGGLLGGGAGGGGSGGTCGPNGCPGSGGGGQQGGCSGGSCGGGDQGGCGSGGCGGSGGNNAFGQKKGRPIARTLRAMVQKLAGGKYLGGKGLLGGGLGGGGLGGGILGGSQGGGTGGGILGGSGGQAGGGNCTGGSCSAMGGGNRPPLIQGGNPLIGGGQTGGNSPPLMDCTSGTCQMRSLSQTDIEKKNLDFDPKALELSLSLHDFTGINFRQADRQTGKVREWQKEEEIQEDAKAFITEIKKFKKKPSDVKPENVDTFDRGVMSAQEAKTNHETDMKEILEHYGKNGAPGSCGGWEIVVPMGCMNVANILEPFFIPLWRYWLPVQKVETDPVPGKTGYLQRQKVKGLLRRSDFELYMPSADMAENFEQMRKGLQDPTNYTKTQKVDHDLLATLPTRLSLDEGRRRSGRTINPGHMNTEYHFMPTGFHEEYKDDEDVAGDIGNANWQPVWCHQGAKRASYSTGQQPKLPIPMLYSEFPEGKVDDHKDDTINSSGIYGALLHRTYAWKSYANEKLRKYRPSIQYLMNCYKKNLHSAGGQTPDEGLKMPAILQGDHRQGSPEKCFNKNHTDTVAPITNIFKTLYPAIAGEMAFLRGLVAAHALIPNAERIIHPVRTRNDHWLFKRDRQQVLTNPPHNSEFPKGCGEFNSKEEITSDWGGFDYEKANHVRIKNHRNRQVRVHWRQMLCCPSGYVTVFPQQTF